MGQVLRDMDKQQSLIDEAVRINALAADNDITPLNLGPLARMSVQASLRKLNEKLSEVIVALGGEPLPPIGPLKDYGAAIINLDTNIVAAETLNNVPEQGEEDFWPVGSKVFLDLAGNRAWSLPDGVVALTDYIGSDPVVGTTNYVPGNLVEGVGYREADGTPSNSGFSLKGTALTTALDADGVVIVVKGVTIGTGTATGREFRLYLTDENGNTEVSSQIRITAAGADDGGCFIADFVNFEMMQVESGHGDHNLAYRFTPTEVAASIDGQAVVEYANPDVSSPISIVSFIVINNFAIESVAIYDVADKAKADLPALAAN